MEQNKPAETFQPVKEDNLFKQTVYSGNFLAGSTTNAFSIYFPLGNTGIYLEMVNNPYVTDDAHLNADIALDSNLEIWAIFLKFS